jgi:hypothetical protein
MQNAGSRRLLVVEACRWLCLVTRFVHVVARRRRCRCRCRLVGVCVAGGSAVTLWAVLKPYDKVRVRCPFHHDHVTGRAAAAWREVCTRLSRIEH